MEIRLIGPFEEVEAITRELRRQFEVVTETDRAAARSDWIRRYLTVYVPSLSEKGKEKVK